MGARKRAFGPWMLRAMGALRHGKALRGTPLDVFGYAGERREERALRDFYEDGIARLLADLTPATHARAVEWAEVAATVKGFGHVKARNLAGARAQWAALDAGPATGG